MAVVGMAAVPRAWRCGQPSEAAPRSWSGKGVAAARGRRGVAARGGGAAPLSGSPTVEVRARPGRHAPRAPLAPPPRRPRSLDRAERAAPPRRVRAMQCSEVVCVML